MSRVGSIAGVDFWVSDLVPPRNNIEISPSFKFCSDAFRREYNAWLAERFGTHEVAYIISGGMISADPIAFINPRAAARIDF
jgi:hypothetical protein